MPTNLNNTNINLSTSGFTFLELLVVTAMMGILSAIAAPSWLSFTNVTRLKTAQDEIYFAMRQAQSQAKLQKLTWQTSFREQNGIVQWAVHPASISSDNATWNSLDASVRIDTETTLQQSGDVRRVQFNHIGNVSQLPLGRITISSKNGGQAKRCIFISTILGTMRTAKEQATPDSGRYCY